MARWAERLRLSITLPSSSPQTTLNRELTPRSIINGNACFAYFNKIWGIPRLFSEFG